MLNKKLASIAAVAVLLLAAGCGSTGGIGDILGGGTSQQQVPSSIRGTVDSVDLNSRSIWLTNTNTSLASGSGGSIQVFFDDQTSVSYQGRSYRPQDLDRGDQVDVSVSQSGNRLVANSMTVTYNAAQTSSSTYPSNTYPNGSSYPSNSNYSTVRGTVRHVDTSRRTLQLDSTSWSSGFLPGYNNGSTVTVQFDTNQSVSVNGQLFPLTNLEQGDVVDVQVENLGNSGLFARNITLVRDVRR